MGHVDENVGTGELNEGAPGVGLFGPAGANRAAFGKPVKGAFHDPAAGGVQLFRRNQGEVRGACPRLRRRAICGM